MRRSVFAALLVAAAALGQAPASARDDKKAEEGVKVGNPSFLRKLVSAEKLEQQAEQQFLALNRQAAGKGMLLRDGDPRVQRVRAIAERLIPHTHKWNEERAPKWSWQINVIASPTVNAFCMPGGKIVFFTGIIDRLRLTDDEIAAIMGHEMAHALREHARERLAKTNITKVTSYALDAILGTKGLAQTGGSLLTLKFSRSDESESDLIGIELAARAGYDPRAGVTLWQKMSALNKSAPPGWLSTHPASDTRIKDIEANLPKVMPLYEKAKAAR